MAESFKANRRIYLGIKPAGWKNTYITRSRQAKEATNMAETLGNLIDKLTVTNIRIWTAEDIKRSSADDNRIADACRITNVANSQRNDLIQEIDEMFESAIKTGTTPKLYRQGSTKLYGTK
jgi:hypothetical protein